MIEEDQDSSPHDELFATDHLHADLRRRSLRGGAITLASQIAKLAITLGSLAVLARILSPEDFGLMAMVTIVTGFISMFKDIGLSAATVQRDEISREQISTLFWVNVAASLVLGVITAAVAPVLAWFFGRPELTWMTVCLGSVFLLSGATAQHQALLQRQMRFGTLAMIESGSILIAAIAAIAAALEGWGYWSLVVQQVVLVATTTISVWCVVRWCPSLPKRGSGVRSMLAFGGNLSAFNTLNYFSRNADNFLIGWYWGAQSLGLYSKAYALLLLPITQVNMPIHAVAVPTLSRLANDPPRYRRYVMRELNILMWLTCPAIAVLIGLAGDVIRIALGPQWMEAVPVFRLLGITAFFQVAYSMTGQIFISLNQTDRQFRWALVAMPVFMASFLIGLRFGILGVAACYSIAFLLLLPWTFRYTLRFSPLTPRDLLQSMITPLIVGVVLLVVVWSAASLMSNINLVSRVAVCVSLACVVVIVAFRESHVVKEEVRSFGGLLTGIIRGE